MSLPATPSIGSLERALRDLRRDIDSLRADIFTNPRPMRAALDMGGNRIVNLGKPIDSRDAETKAGRAASGVSSFAKNGSAGITGAVTISEGANITLTQTGQDIAIAASSSGTGDLLADGTVPLTANWDVGAYRITANQLESDVATGTAPLVVASTTVVTNLNADLLDGNSAAAFAAASHAHAASDITSGTLALARGGGAADLSTITANRFVSMNGAGTALTDSGYSGGSFAVSGHTQTAALGGTNINSSASTGIPVVTAGTWSIETPTGTGAPVRATSPTLVTPLLGTPTSGTLTNCTGLPIASGVSGLGTGIATALAVNVGTDGAPVVKAGALGTPSSGNLSACTNVRHWIGSYANGVPCNTTRRFMPVCATLANGNTFDTVQRANMPACTLREMRFWCQTGPGANTYTVRWNNLTTATTSDFTVTAAGATTSTSLSVSVSAGDLCVWDIVASAGSVTDNISCLFLLEY